MVHRKLSEAQASLTLPVHSLGLLPLQFGSSSGGEDRHQRLQPFRVSQRLGIHDDEQTVDEAGFGAKRNAAVPFDSEFRQSREPRELVLYAPLIAGECSLQSRFTGGLS